MKVMALVLVLGLSWALSSCGPATSRTPDPDPTQNRVNGSPKWQPPCADSLYVALKGTPLADMSERESEYFLRKDASCAEFQRAEALVPAASEKTTLGPREGFIMLALVAVFGFLAYGYGM